MNVVVYDRNISRSLGAYTNEGSKANAESWHSKSKAMFPTNIVYVFEDDERQENVDAASLQENTDNVIIINIDQDGTIEDVNLISDTYEFLGFTAKQVASTEDTKTEKTPHFKEYEIKMDVISEYQDISHSTHNMRLDSLLGVYSTQNDQMRKLLDSV